MPDYTLDSDWRQPVIEWNGTPLTNEENGGNDGYIMAAVCLIQRRHTKKRLASMIVALIDGVRALV